MKKVLYQKILFTTLLGFFLLGLNGCESSSQDNSSEVYQPLRAQFLNLDETVDVNSALIIMFSDVMDSTSFTDSSVYILDKSDRHIPAILDRIDQTHLSIQPLLFFESHSQYTLVLTEKIKSINNLAFTEPYYWSFTTGDAIDTQPPQLLSISPVMNEYIDEFTTIALQFDELLVHDETDNLIIKDVNNMPLQGKAVETGSTLRFIPAVPLNINENYTITLEPTVMDKSGNYYEGQQSWNFQVNEALAYNKGSQKLDSALELECNLNALVSDQQFLYIAAEGKVFVINASYNSLVQEATIEIDADVYDVISEGGYLFLATDKGLISLDLETHKILHTLSTTVPLYGIDYRHNRLYAAASSDGIYIIDIHNNSTTAIAQKILLPGTVFDVIIEEDTLYAARYTDGVSVFSLEGVLQKEYATHSTARALQIEDNKLYVSNGTDGVVMIDLDNDSMEVFNTLAYAMRTAVSHVNDKPYLYVADKERGISVFDLELNNRIAQISTSDFTLDTSTNEHNIYDISLIDNMLTVATKDCKLTTYSLIIDVSAPSIVSTDPINSQSDVDLSTDIEIIFSEDINRSSLKQVIVREQNDVDILTTQNYNASTMTLTVSPTESLRHNQWHTVSIDGTIVDLAGNKVNFETYEFSFKTLKLDLEAPTVISVRPTDGNILSAPYTAPIKIVFSELVDSTTVISSNIWLVDECGNGDVVPTTVSYYSSNKSAILQLSYALFESCEGYTVHVKDIRDSVGNVMELPFTSTFNVE
ncbi:MAG: hypothetical protein DRG24_01530, partial [Epsilonproteobacteria bacterium]